MPPAPVSPETMPPDVIVATPVLPLLHVPPEGVQLSVVVPPAHITGVPVIDPTDSHIVNELLFHLSPASSVPL